MSPPGFQGLASQAAHIVSHGMACPVGLFSNAAVAAIAANLKVFDESELVYDRSGDGVTISALSRLPAEATRAERLCMLASYALAEVCRPLASATGVRGLPCFLALPKDAKPTELNRLKTTLSAGVRAQNGAVELTVDRDTLFLGGRAAAFEALHAAQAALSQGRSWLVLVGGVDSLVSPPTLRDLVARDRVLSENNRAGLIPGEGAGFLLLARADFPGASELRALISPSALETTPEAARDSSHNLTRAFAALRQTWAGRVDRIISGQTGQERFERNLSYAYLRNDALVPEPMRGLSLGASVGDAGAAAGALALVAASVGLSPLRPGREPAHRSALVYSEADDGVCGASIVSASR